MEPSALAMEKPRDHFASWCIPARGSVVFGKYRVGRECGRGGLAVVLAAQHLQLCHAVALKVLLPNPRADRQTVERFVREGRVAAALGSEHALRVYDVDTLEGGAPCLVLEYLEGEDLTHTLAARGPLASHQAVDWLLQACEALSEAHARGIVHRDIKPANLFVTRGLDGAACIKVIDFGLSGLERQPDGEHRLTRPRVVMGSPHYMAPEQVRSLRHTDSRVDIWALGIVLHECLAGAPPFRGETLPELFVEILTGHPERIRAMRPDVPEPVAAAIERCLERDPGARFAHVAELARTLAPYGSVRAGLSLARIERHAAGARLGHVERQPVGPPAALLASGWAAA
jgi:serine/threonine-protein kinase